MTSEEKKLSFMKDTVTHSLPYYSTLAVLDHEMKKIASQFSGLFLKGCSRR